MVRIFCFVLLCNIACTSAWRPFVHHMNEMNCSKTSEHLKFFNCSLKKGPIESTKDLLNFSFTVGKTIQQPKIQIAVTIMRRKFPDFNLLNTPQIDACQYLEGNQKDTNHFLKIVRRTLKKYVPDLPKGCPILEGFELHIKDFTLSTDEFPSYVPEMNYRVNVFVSENIIPIFSINITGKIERKNIRKN